MKAIQSLGAENDSSSRELARATVDAGKTYFRPVKGGSSTASFTPVMQYRRDRFLRSGDHSSFNQQGFAAVRITEWQENYNHQHQDLRTENGVDTGDLLKFVDFNYVANVVKLNAATMATLASAPAPPEEVKIETKKLDNNTTLTWKDGPGAPETSNRLAGDLPPDSAALCGYARRAQGDAASVKGQRHLRDSRGG